MTTHDQVDLVLDAIKTQKRLAETVATDETWEFFGWETSTDEHGLPKYNKNLVTVSIEERHLPNADSLDPHVLYVVRVCVHGAISSEDDADDSLDTTLTIGTKPEFTLMHLFQTEQQYRSVFESELDE